MSTTQSPDGRRLAEGMGTIPTAVIDIDAISLAKAVWSYLRDVANIHNVTSADLTIFNDATGKQPTTVKECLENGCKFFDSIYYIALENKNKVDHKRFDSVPGREVLSIGDVQRNLLLLYLYIMFRGNYPINDGKTIGKDIPAFLNNMLGFKNTPLSIAESLASFNIQKVPIDWIKHIDVKKFSPAIQQRIALGCPGYRMMTPFIHYECKQGVSQLVKDTHEWVRQIAMRPADWGIFPGTRDPSIIQRLGALNKNLGNLMLECFTSVQLQEMASQNIKMIYEIPVHDARYENWRVWSKITDLDLNNPIIS